MDFTRGRERFEELGTQRLEKEKKKDEKATKTKQKTTERSSWCDFC